jgi:ABC-type dipeptide/oligopeptide/nickel transport system permease subunit
MRSIVSRPSGLLGLGLTVTVVGIALVGPFFAPHSPSEFVGIPLRGPSRHALLGTDFLGRDVLSRLFWGGRTVLAYSALATLLAYCGGLTIGLIAGYTRSLADPVLMRAVDVLLSFPPILLLLVVATGAGHSAPALIIAVAVTQVPAIARIIRAATLNVAVRGYVEAAVARGERTASILGREVLPNVLPTILADAGIRLSGAIILIASVNFLGLGLEPPAADWALMISENRGNITLQPWAVAAPAILLALLTIGINLFADALARSLGISTDRRRGAT